jgi:hypothetical protein
LIATVVFGFIGNAQRYTSSQFDKIGKEHNRMLDVAYDNIVAKNITNATKTELIPILQESLGAVYTYSTVDLTLGKKNIAEIGKTPINIDKNFYTIENATEISQPTRIYLDKLHNLVMLQTLTAAQIVTGIEKLENDIYADGKINNEQLLIFYSGSFVAKNSTIYWDSNITKWENLSSPIHRVRPKRILGADVGGAVIGAVGAALVNVVPGAGQVAYGSAIVAGAACGSLAEALSQAMDILGW